MIHDNEKESESLQLGAYGWRHDHWCPEFYAAELPEDWRLTFYANEFSAVLVPASYLGGSQNIEQWCEDVDDDFRFYFEWPEQLGADDSLLMQLESMGGRLGGILLNSDSQLNTDCPVYSWRGRNHGTAIWQPSHAKKSDLAVFAVEQYDLKQQRQWLETFMEDNGGRGRAILLSDAILNIKALRELKTLIELKGF